MLKLRVTLTFSVIAGCLTFLFGMLQDARLMTLLYRTIVSSFIFGLVGLLIGISVDAILNRIKLEKQTTGKNIDVTTTENEMPNFSPFTPDMVERISRTD